MFIYINTVGHFRTMEKMTIKKDIQILVRYIDHMLEENIKSFQKKLCSLPTWETNLLKTNITSSPFYNKILPSISIIDYLYRVVKYTNIEFSTLMFTCIYLERFFEKNNVCLVYNLAHR